LDKDTRCKELEDSKMAEKPIGKSRGDKGRFEIETSEELIFMQFTDEINRSEFSALSLFKMAFFLMHVILEVFALRDVPTG